MDNFNLKKYLAESKLLKEDASEYKVGDKVKFNPSTMKDKGFEDLQQYYGGLIGVIEKVSQDELEIKLNKSITPPGGGNIDGILLMKSEGDYEMLAEGKLSEGIWKIGSPNDIDKFIDTLEVIKDDYYAVVGSDTVMDGLDTAIQGAKDLLALKIGNVQAEGKLLKEVRGPLKMELNIKKGEGIDIDMIMDDYGFEENVDGVSVEDLFDEKGFALRDMVIVYDQRDDMYLMDAEDMSKYH